jgi:hypothetical protein
MPKVSEGFAKPKPAKQPKNPPPAQSEIDESKPPFWLTLIVNIRMISFALFQLGQILLEQRMNAKSKSIESRNPQKRSPFK